MYRTWLDTDMWHITFAHMQTGNAILTHSDTDTFTFDSCSERKRERAAKAKNLLHKLNFILCTFQSWKCAENLQRRMQWMVAATVVMVLLLQTKWQNPLMHISKRGGNQIRKRPIFDRPTVHTRWCSHKSWINIEKFKMLVSYDSCFPSACWTLKMIYWLWMEMFSLSLVLLPLLLLLLILINAITTLMHYSTRYRDAILLPFYHASPFMFQSIS